MFHYENDCFKALELRPVTGINDGWQSERTLAAEVRMCEKAVQTVGKRVSQEHPFFTELYSLLEDSSLTDEEVVNNVTQIEVLMTL